jgi:response regulator RpfG family c-di-GMP phosphodiesterase
MSEKSKHILIAEDDTKLAEMLKKMLDVMGYQSTIYSNGQEAYTNFDKDVHDLIISDYNMPVMNGIEFLEKFRERYKDVPFIILTAYIDLVDTREAVSIGATEIVTKPFMPQDFILKINKALGVEEGVTLSEEDNMQFSLDQHYRKISIDHFVEGQYKEFNRYLRLSQRKYIVIAKAGDPPDLERLKQYRKKGIESIYIETDDLMHRISNDQVEAKKITNANDSLKTEFISICERALYDQMIQDGVEPYLVEHAKEIMTSTIEIVKQSNVSTELLKALSQMPDFLHSHAVGVSIVGFMIGINLDMSNKTVLQNIAMGGFLHDIGKIKLDKNLYSKPLHQLTPPEKRELQEHITLGVGMISEMPNIPEVVTNIVAQHHENCSGNGYPNKLQANKIAQSTKIVTLASDFCHLTIKNPVYRHMSAQKAIRQLEKTDYNLYDRDIFIALRKIYKLF